MDWTFWVPVLAVPTLSFIVFSFVRRNTRKQNESSNEDLKSKKDRDRDAFFAPYSRLVGRRLPGGMTFVMLMLSSNARAGGNIATEYSPLGLLVCVAIVVFLSYLFYLWVKSEKKKRRPSAPFISYKERDRYW
jgi:membrane protein implicated in regulation of membrane protease activity